MDVLQGMGFSEADAAEAIRRCKGDVEQAVNLLLSSPGGLSRPAAAAAAAAAPWSSRASSSRASSSRASRKRSKPNARGHSASARPSEQRGRRKKAGPDPRRGKVRMYNEDKGFGFIQRFGLKDIFFHVSKWLEPVRPERGDDVEFEVGTNPHNELDMAFNVKVRVFANPRQVEQREKHKPGREFPKDAFSAEAGQSRRGGSSRGAGGAGGDDDSDLRVAAQRGKRKAKPQRSARLTGTVCHVREGQYGLITMHPSGDTVFYDIGQMQLKREPRVGDTVQFTMVDDNGSGRTAYDIQSAERLDSSEAAAAVAASVVEHRGPSIRPPASEYVRNEIIELEEDRETEFKSFENTRHFSRSIEQCCHKYLNAFLNTRGGTLFFGIHDDGTIRGIRADRNFRDTIRRELDGVIYNFTPSIEDDMYEIFFIPVLHEATYRPIHNVFVVAITIRPGDRSKVYTNGNREAWIRQDGSVRQMPPEMIQQRSKNEEQSALQQKVNALEEQNARMMESFQKVVSAMQAQGQVPPLPVPVPAPAAAVPTAVPAPAPHPALPAAASASASSSSSSSAAAGTDAGTTPQSAPAGPAVSLNQQLIEQFTSMSFPRGQVLEVLYALSTEGNTNPSQEDVLNRLLS